MARWGDCEPLETLLEHDPHLLERIQRNTTDSTYELYQELAMRILDLEHSNQQLREQLAKS